MRLLTVSIVVLVHFGLVSSEANDSEQLDDECGRFLAYKFFSDGNKTEFDDYPWTAMLIYDTPRGQAIGCGGALLSKRYVLTAAHCVAKLGGNWNLRAVRLGEYNTDTDVDCYADNNDTLCAPKAKDYSIDELIPHEEYDPTTSRAHDIALIRLNETVPKLPDYLRAICLPTRQAIPQKFHVAGWGRLAGRKGTNLKLRSTLTRINASQCRETYTSLGVNMATDQICAGKPSATSNEAKEEPCIADSGGPLMGIEKTSDNRHRMTVFGVLTTDAKFCDTAQPAIFIDVLRYKNWIVQRVRE